MPLAAVSDRKGVVQWHHWLVHQPAPPPPPGGRPREALFGRWHHDPQQVDRWDIGGIATDGDMCKFENGVLWITACWTDVDPESWRVGVRREALQRTAVAAPGKPLTCERLCSNEPGTCMNLCFICFLHNVNVAPKERWIFRRRKRAQPTAVEWAAAGLVGWPSLPPGRGPHTLRLRLIGHWTHFL